MSESLSATPSVLSARGAHTRRPVTQPGALCQSSAHSGVCTAGDRWQPPGEDPWDGARRLSKLGITATPWIRLP